jgi:hypothetical protein
LSFQKCIPCFPLFNFYVGETTALQIGIMMQTVRAVGESGVSWAILTFSIPRQGKYGILSNKDIYIYFRMVCIPGNNQKSCKHDSFENLVQKKWSLGTIYRVIWVKGQCKLSHLGWLTVFCDGAGRSKFNSWNGGVVYWTSNCQNNGNTWVIEGYNIYRKQVLPHRCGFWVN